MKYLQTETTERGPFFGKTGACQTAQNGPMLNFFDQNCLKSNLNGGHFYEKNSNVFKLGPQSVGRFHQTGVCQAAEKGQTKKKLSF